MNFKDGDWIWYACASGQGTVSKIIRSYLDHDKYRDFVVYNFDTESEYILNPFFYRIRHALPAEIAEVITRRILE